MSDNIIDFNERKNAAERPDAEFVRRDDFGREMFKFLLSYDMDGKEWGTDVWAYDAEDAAKRVEGMRASLRCDGQIFTVIQG